MNNEELFKIVSENRKMEINLFWQRSNRIVLVAVLFSVLLLPFVPGCSSHKYDGVYISDDFTSPCVWVIKGNKEYCYLRTADADSLPSVSDIEQRSDKIVRFELGVEHPQFTRDFPIDSLGDIIMPTNGRMLKLSGETDYSDAEIQKVLQKAEVKGKNKK